MKPRLTPRERAIIGLLFEGLTLKEIAARFGTSHGLVRQQIQKARDKTGCRSNAELAVKTHEAN